VFGDLPHICVGQQLPAIQNQDCYKFEKSGAWTKAFTLGAPLLQTGDGASVVFADWNNITTPWWIINGDTRATELWGASPLEQYTGATISLEEELNKPCVVKISAEEALVVSVREGFTLGSGETNYAAIFNLASNTWTSVPSTGALRRQAACGYIETTAGEYVVLAGGGGENTADILDTVEIFDISTRTWQAAAGSLPTPIAQGRMISVNNNTELLLIGGTDGTNELSTIWQMDTSMTSWTNVGSMNTARADPVALFVPIENLPTLCP